METKTLLVDLKGPFTLSRDKTPQFLLSCVDARQPGIFIWTLEHNRAHRIHFVGTAKESVTKSNLALATEVLLGERCIYDPIKLDEGSLQVLADSHSSNDQRCGAASSAIGQLTRVQIFFAASLGTPEIDQLVCDGIIRKLLNFGELPTAWLEHGLRHEPPINDKQNLTIRFQRPAFISSLPDEMYL